MGELPVEARQLLNTPVVPPVLHGRGQEGGQRLHGDVVPVVRAPRQTTLAWLWRRANAAVVTSWMTAARTPGILLAAMAIPMPVPQTQSPRSADPSATARPTAAPKSG